MKIIVSSYKSNKSLFWSCAFEGLNFPNLELDDYNLNDFLDEKHILLEVAEKENKDGQKK